MIVDEDLVNHCHSCVLVCVCGGVLSTATEIFNSFDSLLIEISALWGKECKACFGLCLIKKLYKLDLLYFRGVFKEYASQSSLH